MAAVFFFTVLVSLDLATDIQHIISSSLKMELPINESLQGPPGGNRWVRKSREERLSVEPAVGV